MTETAALPVGISQPTFSKDVVIRGHALTIYGHETDAYFEHLETHLPSLASYARIIDALPDEPCIIDVGANIGVTVALALAVRPKAQIFALEPSPKAFACLRLTSPSANLLNVAAGARSGTARLVEASFLAASHLGNDGVDVPVVTVDQVVMSRGLEPDLIKIDVEGFEPDVIEGMRRTLRLGPLVYMEFNAYCLTAHHNSSPRSLLDRIAELCGPIFYEQDGAICRAATHCERVTLLHETMVRRGCVHDLLFSTLGDADVRLRNGKGDHHI